MSKPATEQEREWMDIIRGLGDNDNDSIVLNFIRAIKATAVAEYVEKRADIEARRWGEGRKIHL